eukprot:scaffold206201_cov26-Tisochrysis_lutea.AAC.1
MAHPNRVRQVSGQRRWGVNAAQAATLESMFSCAVKQRCVARAASLPPAQRMAMGSDRKDAWRNFRPVSSIVVQA